MSEPTTSLHGDANERVICVDEADQQVGEAGKLKAHERGLLHRAFSVFLFDDENRLLLQRRAITKYHSGSLWANSCCGHPRPNEPTLDAAVRRTREELGITAQLKEAFCFRYQVDLSNGLIENELVHMMFGRYRADPDLISGPAPDPNEVAELRWMDLQSLSRDIGANPESYAPWLRLYVKNGRGDLLRALQELGEG